MKLPGFYWPAIVPLQFDNCEFDDSLYLTDGGCCSVPGQFVSFTDSWFYDSYYLHRNGYVSGSYTNCLIEELGSISSEYDFDIHNSTIIKAGGVLCHVLCMGLEQVRLLIVLSKIVM